MSEFPQLSPVNCSGGPDYLTGWDLCILGGARLPGFAEVSGPGIKLKRDPNSKPGSNGGKPVYLGLEEQEPKIKIVVWTQSQLDILLGMKDGIIPVAGKEPKTLSIISPFLRMIDIDSVTIIGATPLQFHSSARCGHGLEMTLSAVHWLGAAKGHGKNVTKQPRRTVNTTRPYAPGQPPPTAVAGACGPSFTPGA